MGGLVGIFLCAGTILCGTSAVHATVLTVTTTADSGAGSLRDAIAGASDADIIQFDSSLNGQTIGLTSGELLIDKRIIIRGPGPNLLGVSRQSPNFFRIVSIGYGNTAIIEGLTISGGYLEEPGGGIEAELSTLILSNCIITNNFSPSARGGGLYGFGTLVIINSRVDFNRAGLYHYFNGWGGGMSVGGTVTIVNSTISNNNALFWGGAIEFNGGTLTIVDSTISGNSAGSLGVELFSVLGGGIRVGQLGTLVIRNSTISDNWLTSGPQPTKGGGIYSFGGRVTVSNSTISNNRATNGSGIYNTEGGVLDIGSTILSTSSTGSTISNDGGTITSHGYNLCNDGGGGFFTAIGDQINTNPLLGPLEDNGGPTYTHALLTGSPAINAADPDFTPPPFFDQRGYSRVFDGRVDIGSFELQPTPTATATPFPVTVSGIISSCSDLVPGPVANVALMLVGDSSGIIVSNESGSYAFSLPSSGSYVVTPMKAGLAPGSPAINTVDVVAVQRHFLNLGTPLTGCRLMAANVDSLSGINTVDVVAIQRFFLAMQSTANVGKYQFDPSDRIYSRLVTSLSAQDYHAFVLGDVASPFVE